MKRIGVIALAILLTGCATSQIAHKNTISQDDVSAISIDSPTTFSVSRVVVLANGVAEIMNSLNAKSLIVGRDISSTEKELESVPLATSGHQVLPEEVIALKPDLVIIDASTGPKAAIEQIDVGAASLPRPFNTMTAESLATLNPDLILVMTKGLESVGGVSGLLKLPGVAQTKAGKNHAIIDVDDSLLLSFGPRTPSLVVALGEKVSAVLK